ncbi:hypothetical protein TcasGA2_TC034330 [Tribolium castaneum]|uniref:KHA domain-containing protein n=1 Tax=Tribolium castaneum TaxID=7070 RepID=A0A139WCD8_TRICA|nr:hypothetical protein TcasGA2_TC034330 [Tribolium castaneum]
MSEKRVVIFRNGTNTHGKVFALPQTLEELMSQEYLRFNSKVRRLLLRCTRNTI